MAKKESTLINMVITLLGVSLIAAAALGYIYGLTAKPIEEASLRKTVKAIEMVLPEFDNNPKAEMYEVKSPNDKLDNLEIYPAKKGGQLTGIAIRTSTKSGFTGLIRVMVGFTPDGKIHNTFVLEHKETPGLGTKMSESKFKDQFFGKNPAEFKLKVGKDGGDVDAITAATISSRAFCEALSYASEVLEKIDKTTGLLKE